MITVGTRGQKHNSLLVGNTEHWVRLKTRNLPAAEREPAVTMGANEEGWVPDESDHEDNVQEAEEVSQGGQNDDPVFLEGANRKRLFPCDVDGCIKVFQSYHNWYHHVTTGKHVKRVERQSLRDFSINKYVELLENKQAAVSSLPEVVDAIRSQRDQETAEEDDSSIEPLPMGWALKMRRPSTEFSNAQKQFLTEKFNEGAKKKGTKWSPNDVAKLMRRQPQFPNKEDWLTATQIASFWSGLARKREERPAEQQANDNAVPDQRLYHTDEIVDSEYANGFQEHMEDIFRSVIARMRQECDEAAQERNNQNQ